MVKPRTSSSATAISEPKLRLRIDDIDSRQRGEASVAGVSGFGSGRCRSAMNGLG